MIDCEIKHFKLAYICRYVQPNSVLEWLFITGCLLIPYFSFQVSE